MGTHPIFESDFDCLTDKNVKMSISRGKYITNKYDQCKKSFNTIYQLNRHYSMHEGIIYHCLICTDYQASRKDTMLMHIRMKHEDVFGKNIHWDTVKTVVKTE